MPFRKKFAGEYVTLPLSLIFKKARDIHLLAFVTAGTITVLAHAADSWRVELEKFIPAVVVAILWALVMSYLIVKHHKMYVLTDEGEAQRRLAEQASLERSKKFWTKAEDVLSNLWARYPLGALVAWLAIFMIDNSRSLAPQFIAVVLLIWVAWLWRELVIPLLVIAGIYYVWQLIGMLSVPAAIIVGAIIIAMAVNRGGPVSLNTQIDSISAVQG